LNCTSVGQFSNPTYFRADTWLFAYSKKGMFSICSIWEMPEPDELIRRNETMINEIKLLSGNCDPNKVGITVSRLLFYYCIACFCQRWFYSLEAPKKKEVAKLGK
jgi:hypothetical protein